MGLAFSETYLGKLRARVGNELLLATGFRIIIEDLDGRILLIKRSDNGMWGLPAGCAELGESMQTCIRREVLEETGLILNHIGCFGLASDPAIEVHSYPNGDRVHSYAFLAYSNSWSGEARINDHETTAVTFVHPRDFPAPELILQNEIRSLIAFHEFKKSKEFQWQ